MVIWRQLHARTNKVATALFALLLVLVIPTPTLAQLGRDSDWNTPQGTLRIFDPGAGRSSSTLYPASNWKSGIGPRLDLGAGLFIEMQGSYRNLRWSGEYWIMGGGARHRPRRGCLSSRPQGYTAADDSYDHGTFTVTFNAAENSFTGTRQWKCKFANGAARTGPVETFSGTRANTLTVQSAPPLSRAILPPTASPGNPGTGTPSSPNRPVTSPSDCRRANFTELLLKTPGAPDKIVALSTRYAVNPCSIDALAGDKFDILLRHPEGKRPMRLYLREYQLAAIGPATDPRTLRAAGQFGTEFFAIGLPFVGDPRPGFKIADRTMRADFCKAPFWVAYLDFSDGNRSEPFAVSFSLCGSSQHPEKMPRSAGGGLSSQPIPELRERNR